MQTHLRRGPSSILALASPSPRRHHPSSIARANTWRSHLVHSLTKIPLPLAQAHGPRGRLQTAGPSPLPRTGKPALSSRRPRPPGYRHRPRAEPSSRATSPPGPTGRHKAPAPKATGFRPEPTANSLVAPASVGRIRAFSCKIPLDAPCEKHYTPLVAHKHKWGPPCVPMS